MPIGSVPENVRREGKGSSMEPVLVSVVIPVYRGRETLELLMSELEAVRSEWQRRMLPVELVEVICVDDGSADGSESVLERLQRQYSWLRVIPLSRNFGQHPATVAGLLEASGDWVVTMDEDRQHPPRFLLSLLHQAITTSSDLVYAQPNQPVHQSRFRDASSRLSKSLIAIVTRNPHVRSFNSFRLIRGSIARAAAAVSAHETYLDVSLCWFTDRITTLPLPLTDYRYARDRQSGYSFGRLLSHARRLAVSSQAKWLRCGALIGTGAMLLSVLLGSSILLRKLADPSSIQVQGWTSLFLMVLFFGGLTSLLLGILLEFQSVILLQSLGRPTYFVVDRAADAQLREALFSEDRSDAHPELELSVP